MFKKSSKMIAIYFSQTLDRLLKSNITTFNIGGRYQYCGKQ